MDLHKFGDSTALISPDKSYSYSDLDAMSDRAALLLLSHGVVAGDRVFIYLDRCVEYYFFTLGILKIGAVYCPLFSSFGHDAVMDRISDGGGSLVITQPSLVENICDTNFVYASDIWNFEGQFLSGSLTFHEEEPTILHYTSGTTGKPKGALHARRALSMHESTSRNILGITPQDIYWCSADPAWVTGSAYGIFGPLQCGAAIVVCDPGFRLDLVFKTLQDFKVTIWYTSPTLLRMIMREDALKIKKYDLTHLKRIFAVGEALNPEIIKWSTENIGLPIYDTWFQTETGAIMICNHPGLEVKPGSMGKPINGIEACVLDDHYEPAGVNILGHLALKSGWDSMFIGYWKKSALYEKCFQNGWYITGDLARMDESGYFWFGSREDDIINTAGHLISPFEIESIIMQHEAVAETAAMGMADKLMGEVVKAWVVLKEGYSPTDALRLELRMLVRNRIANYATPQTIEFVEQIPKTNSGKIIRSASS